ncbi:MAG: hypothetical protein MK220_03025 [Candidatus Poseidoniia archaeon]|nr:hypothetical protein [Candidatus Poseidoniia archaeon]
MSLTLKHCHLWIAVAEDEQNEPGEDEAEQETAERKRVTKRDRKAKRSYSRYRHGGRRGTRDD